MLYFALCEVFRYYEYNYIIYVKERFEKQKKPCYCDWNILKIFSIFT